MSEPLDPHARAIGSFRRRLALLLAVRRAAAAATVFFFLYGTALLATRIAPGLPRPPGSVAALLLLVLVVALLPRALGDVPAPAVVRALLDARGRRGGLVMAAGETPLGDWAEDVSSVTPLRLLWKAGRTVGALLGAALFVLLAVLLPERVLSPAKHLEVRRDVERLAGEIEALKEEELLAKERADALSEKLSDLEKDASGNDPAKTWEALDHLEGNVQAAAQEGAESALAKAQRLSHAEAVAEGIAGDLAALSPSVLADAMADLAKRVDDAARETKGLTQSLSKDLLKAMRSGSLTPDQLKELARALRGAKESRLGALKKLYGSGLVDLKTLRQAEKLGEKEARGGLDDFLKKNPGATGDAIEKWCQKPGKGGVDRGRGDASMEYGKATKEDGTFKEKVLPPAAVDALRESQTLGTSQAEPDAGTPESAARGALLAARAGGGSASKEPLLPRHKAAVSRYFEREGRK